MPEYDRSLFNPPAPIAYVALENPENNLKIENVLERDCYKVESVSGDYITISEMLDGYVELYKTLEKNVPSIKFVK
jgi:hypothetical protein